MARLCVAAGLGLVILLSSQAAVLACIEQGLCAKIRHSFTGENGSWAGGNLEICAGTTVYFRASDPSGQYPASYDDLDVPVGAGCAIVQKIDTAVYHWDFDYDSEDPNDPSVDAEGVGIDAFGVADVLKTFSEPGVYTVRLDVDDLANKDEGDEDYPTCLHDDDAKYDEITVTVVEPDIDTDSDNDGTIEDEDDAIEALYPGKYVEIDGDLAEVDLGYLPTLAGRQLRLQVSGSGVIAVYGSDGTTLITQWPQTYTIPTVPSKVYVKGVGAGSATLDWAYLDGSGNPACTDTVRFTAATSLPDDGLPKDNLNDDAGANRRNIRWSNPNTDVAYADAFTLPSGNWAIKKVRMWAVPPVPVLPSYAMGDHYSAITLCGGSTDTLTSLVSGTLLEGHNSTTSITCTPVMYHRPPPLGDLDYQLPDGTYNQIWQVDFDVDWSVTGGTAYRCGMYGAPRYDRLWFTHATYKSGSSNQFLPFDVPTPQVVRTSVTGEGWFGKGSDLNIQLFYSPQ